MIGFVYSLPGIKDGKPTQWSHMLGVLDAFRNDGAGRALKRLQRERTLAMGLDLIEWTYDPMQAMNAHLNFARLGVVVEEYEENVYGESTSPLHKGNPTDRFVAEWWIRTPHVERRLVESEISSRDHGIADAARVNRAAPAGEWLACADVDLALDARRLVVEIPMGFGEMLSRAPILALAWRMATREIFTTYFARGYRAVDFVLDRGSRKGAYLLSAGLKACTTSTKLQPPASIHFSKRSSDPRSLRRAARFRQRRRGPSSRRPRPQRARVGGVRVEQQACDQAAACQRSADADQRAGRSARRRGAAPRRTPSAAGPSASRIPISGRRRLTEYQIDP
jgi:predicted GNAT superfamily acetyltransferase